MIHAIADTHAVMWYLPGLLRGGKSYEVQYSRLPW
jgi:hypothetical protein